MSTDKYLTIKKASEGIYRDRGSRFLAFVQPALSVEECVNQLELFRQTYRDARHHCFAYRLNPEDEIYRYSDDGEPNGTAGRPIFEQLKAHKLFNVNLIVVRYFGGTLLGTGGLYQAYKKAAGNALSHAIIIESEMTRDIEIQFPYTSIDRIMQWIDKEHFHIVDKEFTLTGKIVLRVRKGRIDDVMQTIKGLPETRGVILNNQ
jgi:uncharacterized YigZ family protein